MATPCERGPRSGAGDPDRSSLGWPWHWGGQAILGHRRRLSVPAVAQGRVRSASRCSGSRRGGAREESEDKEDREERKTKRPEKKSATPAAAVSEPSFARAPTTKKRSPAPIQPASEPVASSPAPSSSGGAESSSAGTERSSSAGTAWHRGRRSLAWHCAGGRMTYRRRPWSHARPFGRARVRLGLIRRGIAALVMTGVAVILVTAAPPRAVAQKSVRIGRGPGQLCDYRQAEAREANRL